MWWKRRAATVSVVISLLLSRPVWAAQTLSVGTVVPKTIAIGLVTTGSGALPTATWSNTGTTNPGWHGTVGISDLTFTGSWQAQGASPALAFVFSGMFTDTVDGVDYVVIASAGGSGSNTPFTWTSTDPTDSAGGSGTATNGVPAAIGSKGTSITFRSGTTYPAGSQYLLLVGTQATSAVSLNTAAPGAGVSAGSGATGSPPTLKSNGVTLNGGGVPSGSYGPAIAFVTGASSQAAGSWVVTPGVQVVPDTNSWAGNYTAGVQYTISTGP